MTENSPKISPSSIEILSIGLDKDQISSLSGTLTACLVHEMPMDLVALASGALFKARTGKTKVQPDMIICGEAPGKISLEEVGQAVRMQFPDPPFFSVVRNRHQYNRKLLLKNGYTDGFLFPLEAVPLRRAISHMLRKLTHGGVKSYRPVRVADLRPGSELPFSLAVYLPMNARYVTFLNAGSVLTPEHFAKLTSNKFDSVYVNTDEIPVFYEYAGKNSITERRHLIEDEFRLQLSGIFRGWEFPFYEEGKKFIEDCQTAVKQSILNFPKEDITRQVTSCMGDIEDYYSHSLNVATYSALFSMALGVADPLAMGMIGLLHDIGEVDLPTAVALKRPEERTEEETAQYQKHPEMSVRLLQELNLPVDAAVLKAVHQHHEHFDGSGYPTRAQGTVLSKEAQILALADQFDYLTRIRPGQPAMGVPEFIARVKSHFLGSPRTPVDPKLVEGVLKLFEK